MPISYLIDAEQALVYSRASGVVTEPETSMHYERIKLDPAFHPDYRQLCDLQEVSDLRTSREFLRNLAMSSIFARGTRRAIVATTDHYYGLARMMQTFSDLDGREVGVFRTEKEAREWLGLQEGEK